MFPSSLWIGTTAEIDGGFNPGPPGEHYAGRQSARSTAAGAPDEDEVAPRFLPRPAAVTPALHLLDRERQARRHPVDVLGLEEGERFPPGRRAFEMAGEGR